MLLENNILTLQKKVEACLASQSLHNILLHFKPAMYKIDNLNDSAKKSLFRLILTNSVSRDKVEFIDSIYKEFTNLSGVMKSKWINLDEHEAPSALQELLIALPDMLFPSPYTNNACGIRLDTTSNGHIFKTIDLLFNFIKNNKKETNSIISTSTISTSLRATNTSSNIANSDNGKAWMITAFTLAGTSAFSMAALIVIAYKYLHQNNPQKIVEVTDITEMNEIEKTEEASLMEKNCSITFFNSIY